MDYNFSNIPKYNFEGIPKTVQAKPVPVEEPEGLYEGFAKPTAKEIGGAFVQTGKDIISADPLEAISQTGKSLGLGMLGFADMVYSRIMNAAQQLIGKGEIDPEAVRIAGEARQDLYNFEVTDPGAKTLTGVIGSVPAGVKIFFDQLAEPFKESSPNIYAGLKTIGDIGELAAFGEVFKMGKAREATKPIEKAEPLDATFAKDEVRTNIAKERASTKQRPLETLARKEESLKAKPPEPTARDIKQTELEETFKDYNFEGIPEEPVKYDYKEFKDAVGVKSDKEAKLLWNDFQKTVKEEKGNESEAFEIWNRNREINPKEAPSKEETPTPKEQPKEAKKEPWEITKKELYQAAKIEEQRYNKFLNYQKGAAGRGGGIVGNIEKLYPNLYKYHQHKSSVKQALSENKPVPKEVLKDYPELVEKEKYWSPLLDKKGKPKTVYHGIDTEVVAFDDRPRGGRQSYASSSKEGIFFTDRKKTAKYYSKGKNPNLESAFREAKIKGTIGPNIISAQISLKNPLIYDFKGKVFREESYKALLIKAKKEGYDGAIFKNTFDAGEYNRIDALLRGRLKGETIYVVFNPSQIKIIGRTSGQKFKPTPPPEVTKRGIKDIAKDINTALGERGSIGIKNLTPEQEAAILRLKGDIENIKSEAKKVGKTVERYLLDKRYDPQTAYLIHKYADDIPKYARSINLQKQDIHEDYKSFEATLLSEKPKKTQTWEESEKLADKYIKDVKSRADLFIKAKKGTLPLTTEKLLAMRQINVNAIEGLKRVVEMDDPVLAKQALESYRDNIGHVLSDASSEVGRMLNIHKKEVAINNLGKALTELEKELNPRQFEELKNLNLEDPVQVQQFIKDLKDPKLSDYFLEYWYNSILSGPPTHVVNIVGNTLWTMFQVPQRLMTGAVDKVYSGVTGKQRQFYVNEVVPMLAGYRSGFKKGKTTAWEVIRTGKAQKFEDKWYQELDFSMGAWRKSPNLVARKVAPFIDAPTRALRAMDVWANAIAYDGEINSIVRRMANEKGLKGKERAKFELEARKNITEEMHEAAKQKALNSTFMDEPDPFTQYVISSRNIPVIGPVLRMTVLPFVNTISNLTKRGVELTPGLGIAKEAISRGMGRGMPTPKLISKQILGSIAAFYVINKAAEGRITGPMPESKNEREAWYRQRKKPWSIKLGGIYNPQTGEVDGGTWYQYRRIEPYNTPVAGAAMAYEEIKKAMEAGDDKTATEHFAKFADQMKNNVIDGSYLSGLQQVLDKYGGRKGAVPRWLASWVPYSSFWRSINRSVEVMTEGSAKPREGQEWLKAFSQVIPGLSGKMPAKLTVWGEESVIPGGVFQQWLPFKWAKEANDPVEKELERLGFYPGLPRQTVSYRGEDVKLPDDVYRNYCIDFGSELKENFTLRISQDNWDAHPPAIRLKILEKIRSKSGLRARRNLVRNYLSKLK